MTVRAATTRILEAELSVVGAALLDAGVVGQLVAQGLTADHFGESVLGVLWAAAVACYEAGQPVDFVTVAAELRRMGAPQVAVEQLSNALSAVPTAANAAYYAGIVREHAARRQVARTVGHLLEQDLPHGTLQDVRSALEGEVAALYDLGTGRAQGATLIKAATKRVFKSMEDARAAAKDGRSLGSILAVTGIPALDRRLGGLRARKHYVVAGRPGQGKSSFGLQLAAQAASGTEVLWFAKDPVWVPPVPTAVFEIEMDLDDTTRRIMAQASGIAELRLADGNLAESKGEWPRLIEACKHLTKLPMWVDDRPHTLASLRAEIRRMVRDKGVRLVVLDYIQLVKNPSNRGREAEVSEVSRTLTELVKDETLPAWTLVSLAQLNRGNESGTELREPRLRDLRESGQIEMDAHGIIFLHGDPSAASAEDRAKRTAIIAKNRNGETGKVPLTFIGEGTKFVEGAAEDDPPPHTDDDHRSMRRGMRPDYNPF